ncbi:hypothetical protein MANES_06G069950v8 [Manihot esculenta]|uniref:Uncharacterized protein n=1 Tax=Manihot esculenta TaxID=3983 RepID=A0ACB7HJU6_MANES|nr:hypothetical protein MANES_06G069950v8 [Manihot esculenta]
MNILFFCESVIITERWLLLIGLRRRHRELDARSQRICFFLELALPLLNPYQFLLFVLSLSLSLSPYMLLFADCLGLKFISNVYGSCREQVQEVVLSADIRCAECQVRIAEIMSRMAETDSLSVNLLEKKVILTCKYPGVKVPTRQVAAVYSNPLSKIAMFKRIFRSTSS